MFKMFIGGLVVGLALFLTIRTGASRNLQQNTEQKKAEQQKKEAEMYAAELPDATPVQSGILTEKQQAHSKHFNFYREMRSDGGLTSLVAKAKDEGHRVIETVITVGARARPQPEALRIEPKTFFGELVRTSDAVIRGKVAKKASQITENDGFLFTDYDVAVLEILKDNTVAPLASGVTITVTRQGGKVLLDGVIVTAIDKNVLPLPINDHEVVLFLEYLPQTRTYRAMLYCAAYELNGAVVKPLTQAALPLGVIQDRDSFLETIRSIRINAATQKKSGS